MDSETRELMRAFVEEGLELIDDAEQHVETLHESADRPVVDTVFRLFHSLKGSAGYLDLENVQAVTHEAEALLSLFQRGEADLSPRHVELLIEVIDFIRQLIDAVDTHMTDGGMGEPTAPIVRRIQDVIQELREEAEESAEPRAPDETPDDVTDQAFLAEIRRVFAEEAPDTLDRAEAQLEAVVVGEANAEPIDGLAREVHSLKGNAGVLGFQSVVDRVGELESIVRKMADGSVAVTNPTLELIQDELDAVRRLVQEALGEGVSLTLADDAGDSSERTRAEEPAGRAAPAAESPPAETESPAQARSDGEAAESDGGPAAERASAPAGPATSSSNSVRVPTDRLDRLFDLVGELITAESMVANSPDLDGYNLPIFRRRSGNLMKLTRELHEVALSVRMIPLQGTFQKMKRIARDVARRVDKPVQVEIDGGETEMDKTVIEQISDPLVHIIRNAIDHGIESREQRVAAGKPETGSVWLSAGYQGKEIVISVRDDGKGLDREALLAKGRSRGLISRPDGEYSDRDVHELIFEPGFSTREAVSDVSGRGVGMDVVRSNIERARGRIAIESEPGSGSTISMFIPITLAIIDTVTVKIGEQAYSVDLTDVQEFVQLESLSTEQTADGRRLLDLRNRMVPIISLRRYMDRNETTSAVELGRTGMVVAHEQRELCIPVDEVVGTQQTVVKSLPEYTGTVPGVAGMSIMADGKVTFILDVRALAQRILA